VPRAADNFTVRCWEDNGVYLLVSPISLRVGDEPQLGPEPPLDWVLQWGVVTSKCPPELR